MDTITQGLLGAAVTQIGFRSKIGRETAWVSFFAAASPDLDILITPLLRWLGNGGTFDGIIYHRGITHSLFAIPIIAAIFALPWWAIRRRLARRKARRTPNGEAVESPAAESPPAKSPSFLLLFFCCVAAVGTHSLLDACTSYGTQLFAPISRMRIAWDCVGVIDVIYTGILVGTLLACCLIRRKRTAGHAKLATRIALVGFALSCSYLVTGRLMHNLALRQGLAAAGSGNPKIIAARACPMAGSIFLWRVVVQDQNQWYVMRIHMLRGRDTPVEVIFEPRAKPNAAVDLALQTKEYAICDWFADGCLRTVVQKRGDYTIVDFHDMRYHWKTDSIEGLWAFRFVYDRKGRLYKVGRISNSQGRPIGQALGRIWEETWNP